MTAEGGHRVFRLRIELDFEIASGEHSALDGAEKKFFYEPRSYNPGKISSANQSTLLAAQILDKPALRENVSVFFDKIGIPMPVGLRDEEAAKKLRSIILKIEKKK